MLEGFGLRKASVESYHKHCNDMEINPKLSDSKAHNYFHQKRRLLVRILAFGVAITLLRFVYVIAQDGACGGQSNCFMYAAQELNPFGNSALEEYPPRHAFKSQEEYIQLKLNMTVNPDLLRLWTTKEWRQKVEAFSVLFQGLMAEGLLSSKAKALCVGAKGGHEVLALKEIGVSDAVGVDPMASPPLVMEGEMHRQPFEDNTFDFEFSSVFDPSADFASEIERTLKPGGVAVIRFESSGDMYSIDSFIHFFNNCNIVRFTEKDEGYLEIVLNKSVNKNTDTGGGAKCSVPAWNKAAIDQAEVLIEEEPLKPWITLKKNIKNIKYLPSMADIGNRRKYVYVDVGARSYGSSIGGWFKKKYPKQNHQFDVYAIEADRAFYGDYEKRKGVKLLPYAAWVRNETLSFEINRDAGSSVESKGMGRIQPKSHAAITNGSEKSVSVVTVQGFDFAEWLKNAVSRHDFVVMKMDVEGAEFDLLPRLFETGAICLIDELFLECHYNRWQRCCPERTPKYRRTYGECLDLFNSLRKNGVLVHQWW
jgi:FkbM family methyltransferase